MTPQELVGVWALMGQTWGAKFLEQYGEQPNTAWTSALTPLPLEAARHSFTQLLSEGSGFPPTLPEFLKHAAQFRPKASVTRLPPPKGGRFDWHSKIEGASEQVRQFKTYAEYEAWRASKKPMPKHPPCESPDWWFLHRLALIEASEHNQRITNSQF